MRMLLRMIAMALLIAPGLAHADETPPAEPAPAAPKADAPKEETPKPEAPKPEAPEDAPRVEPVAPLEGAAPTPAPETAKAALARIMGEARKAGPQGAKDVFQERATAFVEEAAARGAAFLGEEAVPFARLQALAERRLAAIETLRAAAAEEGLSDDLGTEVRAAFVEISTALVRNKDVAGDAVGATLAEAEKAVEAMRGEKAKNLRPQSRMQLAATYDSIDRTDDALRQYVVAGLEKPVLAARAANAVVQHLLESAKGPDAYPTARAAGLVVISLFGQVQDAALAQAREAKDETLVKLLEAGKKMLATVGVPLDLIGNPMPAWNVVHPFRGGASPADYRGKVVLVDFWATWCPWCIKSFPAMRDLLAEYGERGFTIVGVTTSAPNVFEARYDLDDDLKAKAPADWKPKATLTLPKDATDEAKAEHATREKEVIATFLANHEVPWDVVMIEKEDVARYGLSGWPYGILVDRNGRIRRLHAGAILRENAAQMAEMRERIDALLAEPAGGATPAAPVAGADAVPGAGKDGP